MIKCLIALSSVGTFVASYDRHAQDRLNFMCNSTVEDSARLVTCDVGNSKDDPFHYAGGTFGLGVFGSLRNNPETTGYKIYADCNLDTSRIPVAVLCGQEHLLSPLEYPSIEVFAKTAVTAKAENQHRYDRSGINITAFDTEWIKANFMAQTGYSPHIYHLRHVVTDAPHPLHKEIYFQHRIQGNTLSVLVKRILWSVAHLTKFVSQPLPQRLDPELRMQSEIRRDLANRYFREEIFLRLSWLYRVYDAVLTTVQDMHSRNIIHCDLHGSNIMFTGHVVMSPLSKQMKRIRKAVIEESTAILTGTDMARDFVPLYSVAVGNDDNLDSLNLDVDMFTLDTSSIWLIDTVYAKDITKKQIKKDRPVPCRIYSAARREDVYEIGRSLNFTKAFIEKEIEAKIDLWGSANWAHSYVSYAKEAISSVRNGIFVNMISKPYNREWGQCMEQEIAFRSQLKSVRKDRANFYLNAHKGLPSCSFNDSVQAIANARSFLLSEAHESLEANKQDLENINRLNLPKMSPTANDPYQSVRAGAKSAQIRL